MWTSMPNQKWRVGVTDVSLHYTQLAINLLTINTFLLAINQGSYIYFSKYLELCQYKTSGKNILNLSKSCSDSAILECLINCG